MVNAGIVGASGYSGEELVRILARHPQVQLSTVTSRSLAGTPVVEVMPHLRGLLSNDLRFTPSSPEDLAQNTELDVVFLALPHGVAAEYAAPLVAAGKRVIDLSADFRLGSLEAYREFYGTEHPAPELMLQAPYVLPELADTAWKSATLIACPGCYPTSIIAPLAPLLEADILDTGYIIINAASGVSGAGKKVAEAFIYCERAESMKAYSQPKHRHLSEIEEQLGNAAGKSITVQFNPHLAPMRRGIATTITVKAKTPSLEPVYAAWEKRYAGKPFMGILPTGTFPDTADTVGTNRVDMAATFDNRTGNYIITSAVDNICKGASGQAVQIMNLWFDLNETDGLLF